MSPQPPTHTSSDRIAEHRRQRDLVRASLIARPATAKPTHRRWA
jgi:hypothetical protein